MSEQNNDNRVLIIGASFSGLAAGIYARMNGYRAQIFEMHDKPGRTGLSSGLQQLRKRLINLKPAPPNPPGGL